MRSLLMVFAAGCLGGLANSLVVWQFGYSGINQALGVAISPYLSAAWLYPRIVWGGIWGLLFIVPVLKSQVLSRSIFFCLFPALAQLFIIYPYHTNAGVAGLGLGTLTPVLILFFSWVWAFVAAVALRMARR